MAKNVSPTLKRVWKALEGELSGFRSTAGEIDWNRTSSRGIFRKYSPEETNQIEILEGKVATAKQNWLNAVESEGKEALGTTPRPSKSSPKKAGVAANRVRSEPVESEDQQNEDKKEKKEKQKDTISHQEVRMAGLSTFDNLDSCFIKRYQERSLLKVPCCVVVLHR